jgi:hypothetical protein
MPPFFMSVVSDSDHWLFLWSNGGLTAGRRSPEHALFPYYTDDKLRDLAHCTGSRSIVLIDDGPTLKLWEPFTDTGELYRLERNLYKGVLGNRVFFEEINRDLGLAFYIGWSTSDAFGLVRQAGLRLLGANPVRLRLLDGIQNILPPGVDRGMQDTRSTLLDAYKKNELDAETGLGMFRLSSIPVDRAEPSEALRATTVWSFGLADCTRLLSNRQVHSFRSGEVPVEEVDVRAERGAYYLCASLDVRDNCDWTLVAEVEQDSADVSDLRRALLLDGLPPEDVDRDVDRGSERLRRLIATADGLQATNDRLTTNRHYANVLFNGMRGGLFEAGYHLPADDLGAFIQTRNPGVFARHRNFLSSLPPSVTLSDLRERSAAETDRQLERLCTEYLPLAFSRRHGDPSRPWNHFAIETRNSDGSPQLNYEGNWRDIFQNWEALSLSFPEFVEGMISTFVSASTPDGYNPYRITRDGIDWEKHDPDDPWSYIGYWGDHQIIYLLKLLEISRAHHPDQLSGMLHRPSFAYANVPYRIKPFEQLVDDPFDTIVFDAAMDAEITARVAEVGADGRLVRASDGDPYLVTLAEKLLVTLLAKLANFVPEGGIWLNTQRPEWNDANNALVGRGLSVVTLFYLRRFLVFLIDLFDGVNTDSFTVSEEVAAWLRGIDSALSNHADLFSGPLSPQQRADVLGDLGRAASAYRATVYQRGFSGRTEAVSCSSFRAFCLRTLEFVDHALAANRRSDGLYHAYNLMHVSADGRIEVDHLYEMLEGQVAALSSGFLSALESVAVLDALRESSMYRPDQNSYMLYPDRQLDRFLDTNVLTAEDVSKSAWLSSLVETGDRDVIVRDNSGLYHFAGSFRNKHDLDRAIDELSREGVAAPGEADRTYILALFEDLFDHRSYTGRSGTFFGYEGLGSIYWHMVSKLLLAVKETFYRAVAEGSSVDVLRELADHYYDIREGIGVHKSPDVYGAFPTDPYSHSPGGAGARQPGMTGQVKEDIIARWGELGITVSEGRIQFSPGLLLGDEFLSEPLVFKYVGVNDRPLSLDLESGSLAFTYCQVPFVLHRSDEARILVTRSDGRQTAVPGLLLSQEESREIFCRTGAITSVDVYLTPGL